MNFGGAVSRVSLAAMAMVTALSPSSLQADPVDWPAVLKKADEPGLRRIDGLDDWYFLPSDLRHLATAFKEDAAPVVPTSDGRDPSSIILQFHEALKKKGIHLIVVPVPEKPRIRADRLVAGVKPGDAAATAPLAKASGRFIQPLKAAGVTVFDPSELFMTWLGEGKDPVYCQTDSHYTARTCERLAASLVKASPELAGTKTEAAFKIEASEITFEGDLSNGGAKETLSLNTVKVPAGDAFPAADDESPVLLMGDSHCLVFSTGKDMHAEGAGLFDHLAAQLGRAPSLIAVRGSGANAARVALYRKGKRSSDFLASKKVVIWCFSAREFTQNEGWKKIPLP